MCTADEWWTDCCLQAFKQALQLLLGMHDAHGSNENLSQMAELVGQLVSLVHLLYPVRLAQMHGQKRHDYNVCFSVVSAGMHLASLVPV